MQNVDEMIIKTDVIDLINKKSMERSLKPNKTEVHGECYVSKNNKRKNKINDAKKVLLTVAGLVVVATLTVGAGAAEFTDQVRQEVNSTHTKLNPIGGKYEQQYNYDEGFVDYVDGLNNFELFGLYNQTAGTMDPSERNDIEEVVDEMEDNYLESNGRGGK